MSKVQMSYSPKKKIKNEYHTNSISNISESRFHDLRSFFFLKYMKILHWFFLRKTLVLSVSLIRKGIQFFCIMKDGGKSFYTNLIGFDTNSKGCKIWHPRFTCDQSSHV